MPPARDSLFQNPLTTVKHPSVYISESIYLVAIFLQSRAHWRIFSYFSSLLWRVLIVILLFTLLTVK